MNVKLFDGVGCLIIVVWMLLFSPVARAESLLPLEGNIDLVNQEIEFVIDLKDQGSVTAKIQEVSDGKYTLVSHFNRLHTPIFDITGEVEGSVEVFRHKDRSLKFILGRIQGHHSLVNYKLMRELSGSFEIRDGTVYLNRFIFGQLVFNGSVGLTESHPIDMSVDLQGIDMDTFLNFWVKDKGYDAAGPVSGRIKMKGTLNNLSLKGSLKSVHGFVKKFKYNSLYLNIAGVYPHMQITDSIFSKADGLSYALEGPFNLKDTKNFKKQIKSLTVSPLVIDSGSEVEWTILRLKEQDSATEFKYILRRDHSVSSATTEDSGMLGLERSTAF